MPANLLPLNALMEPLRGFVAVGRHMSITQAAHELCLSQSAVSRQVQALEQRLGVKLLQRGHRAVTFTAEGERLFREADAALRQLQQAVTSISATNIPQPVTVSASIGLTSLWLLPRLGRFQQQHPAIDLRVAASNRLVNLDVDDVDLAIRYCASADAPNGARRLFDEQIAPVASTQPGRHHLQSPDDLDGSVLLEYDDARRPWLQWRDWLQARSWKVRPKAILRFTQYDQVVHSALAGQGIALGRIPLLGSWLEGGQLQLLDTPGKPQGTDHAYWLLQDNRPHRDGVLAVVSWLLAEAGIT
ncbi:LysR substrate-binding domain-containing protein [Dyella sp.]|uniref:LysR substrate-binding domain-containing protein n=1 Tax=Dyella sp. TaxID=1869338 RepID=UPI002ED13083